MTLRVPYVIARCPPPLGRLEREHRRCFLSGGGAPIYSRSLLGSRLSVSNWPASAGLGGAMTRRLISNAGEPRRVIHTVGEGMRRPLLAPFLALSLKTALGRQRRRAYCVTRARRRFVLPLDPSGKTPSEFTYRLPIVRFRLAFVCPTHDPNVAGACDGWIANRRANRSARILHQ